MTSIQISSQPSFQPAPADISQLGGVPVPVGSVMFGAQGGKIYRFGQANDTNDRDFVDGGLEFYGIKGISRWSTQSEKYGLLSYIRFHLVSPYKGVSYCLQLSDGANRDGSAICPPSHVRGLVQSLLKAKRILEQQNQSLAMVPGVICPKGGDDANVTFLNLFVGPDPYDTNSLNQVFCEAEERLEKSFEAMDIAIDELCAHLGQETPSAADADIAAEDAVTVAADIAAENAAEDAAAALAEALGTPAQDDDGMPF